MNPAPPPELPALLAQARSGDLSAQDALIRLYQQRIAAFILALTSDIDSVPDLAQSVFLKMTLRLPQLHDSSRFEAWLFRIARNVCRDHFRREKWRSLFTPFSSPHEELPAPSPSLPSDSLLNALQSLPPAQRELITLLYEREWSYEELASITGSSLSSVKSRLFRARTELKRLLHNE